MNNTQVVAGIKVRARKSIENMLEIGERVAAWSGSLQELVDALAAGDDGVTMSKGTLSKSRKCFEHWGTDVVKLSADLRAAGLEPNWTNAYKLLTPATDEAPVSDGNGEGEEGEEVSAGTADARRIVKIDLDDPLAALIKLSTADVQALATAIAAVLVDNEIKAAA